MTKSLPAPVRQRRNHHNKVRTGCQACKRRRVKCDEAKPVCSRCQRYDSTCSYTVPQAWIFEPMRQICINRASYDERRAFHYFKEHTSATFAGQHDLAYRFWKSFIPQVAATEPLIFKLAVAMGSQHEAVTYGSEKADALSKHSYATVMNTLIRQLCGLSVVVSLLCCGMLMANANLCDEGPATAAIHFSLGLKILRESTAARAASLPDAMRNFIEPMFGELELVAALFATPASSVELIVLQPPSRPSIAECFEDLHVAERTLTDIFRWSLYVSVIFGKHPTELALKRAEVDELLTQWEQAVIRTNLRVANGCPDSDSKARKMLFQNKLFHTCRTAATSPVFLAASRVQVMSIDLSQPHLLSVLCMLKNDIAEAWRPLARASTPVADELDIWPRGEPVGHNGVSQIVRITVGG